MTGTGRIPLWLVALIGGLGVLVVIGSFLFGAYSGLGSSFSTYKNNKAMPIPGKIIPTNGTKIEGKYKAVIIYIVLN